MFTPPTRSWQDPRAAAVCRNQLILLDSAYCYDQTHSDRQSETGEGSQRVAKLSVCENQHESAARDPKTKDMAEEIASWFQQWKNDFQDEYLGPVKEKFPRNWTRFSGKMFERAGLEKRSFRQEETVRWQTKAELKPKKAVRILCSPQHSVGTLLKRDAKTQTWLVQREDGVEQSIPELAVQPLEITEEGMDDLKAFHSAKDDIPKFDLPAPVNGVSIAEGIRDDAVTQKQKFDELFEENMGQLDEFLQEVHLDCRHHDASELQSLRDEQRTQLVELDRKLAAVQDRTLSLEEQCDAVFGQQPKGDREALLRKKRTNLLWEREMLTTQTCRTLIGDMGRHLCIQKIRELSKFGSLGSTYPDHAEQIAAIQPRALEALEESKDRLETVRAKKSECHAKHIEGFKALERKRELLRTLFAQLLKECDQYDDLVVESEAIKYRYGELCTEEAKQQAEVSEMEMTVEEVDSICNESDKDILRKKEKVEDRFKEVAQKSVDAMSVFLPNVAEAVSTTLELTSLSKTFYADAEHKLILEALQLERDLEVEKDRVQRLREAGDGMTTGRCPILNSRKKNIEDIELARCHTASVTAKRLRFQADDLWMELAKAQQYSEDLQAKLEASRVAGRRAATECWAAHPAAYWSSALGEQQMESQALMNFMEDTADVQAMKQHIAKLSQEAGQLREDLEHERRQRKEAEARAAHANEAALVVRARGEEELEAEREELRRQGFILYDAREELDRDKTKFQKEREAKMAELEQEHARKLADLERKEAELEKAHAEFLAKEELAGFEFVDPPDLPTGTSTDDFAKV